MIIQNAPVDPLSDILSLVQAQPACSVRLEAGGAWSLRFRPQTCKFNVIRDGHCWLVTGDARCRLVAGDCVVIKQRAEFVLTSDPALEPVDAAAAFAQDETYGTVGTDHDVAVLGGSVAFGSGDASTVLNLLPDVLVIEAQSGAAPQLAWLLDQLDVEWRGGLAGARAACDDILRLMFIHALRAHFKSVGNEAPGWIAALADPHLAAAVRAIHAEPARIWRLTDLARIAGQSRSAFAAHFRQKVGTSPVEYAANWRLALAASRLRTGREPVSAIAQSLGYTSDSAFGAAFKRRYGASPGSLDL